MRTRASAVAVDMVAGRAQAAVVETPTSMAGMVRRVDAEATGTEAGFTSRTSMRSSPTSPFEITRPVRVKAASAVVRERQRVTVTQVAKAAPHQEVRAKAVVCGPTTRQT